MDDPAERIARALGNGKEVRNGDGHLTLCCCHPNVDTPSLAVSNIGNGDVKVYCHGNDCDYKDIKDELRRRGLLEEWKPDPRDRKSVV